MAVADLTKTGYGGTVRADAAASVTADFPHVGFPEELLTATATISLYMDGVLVAQRTAKNSAVTSSISVIASVTYLAPPGKHTYLAIASGGGSGHWVTGFTGGTVDVSLDVPAGVPNPITVAVVADAVGAPLGLSGTVAFGAVPLAMTGLPGPIILLDATAGLTPVTLGAVTGSGGTWGLSFPSPLTVGHSYRVDIQAQGDPSGATDYVDNVSVGVLVFTVEVAHLVADAMLRREIGLHLRRFVRLYRSIPVLAHARASFRRVIASPPDRSIEPALIEAALAPLHTFTCRLWVQWDGVNWSDETAYLLEASGVDDVDVESRRLNTSEATVTLDNGDLRYSPSNVASPLYPVLGRLRQAVYLEAGYDGHVDTVIRGVVDSLVPKNADRTAALTLLARTADWRDAKVTYGPAANVRSDTVIRAMLGSVGLAEPADFVLDMGDVTLPYALATDAPLVDEIQLVTQAEGGRLFLDPNGVLRFWNRSHTRRVMAQPITTLSTREHLYDLARSSTPQGMATEITLEYEDRQGVGTETVYEQGQPIVISAGYQEGVLWFPSAPVRVRCYAQDYTRWERKFPVAIEAIAAIAANDAVDGSGTVLTCTNGSPPASSGAATPTIYYVVEFGTGVAVLTVWNAWNAPGYIRTLTMTGTPQRPNAAWGVTVDDADAIERYGRIPARSSNPYLPTTDLATELAQERLAQRAGPLNRIDIPLQDGLPFLRPLDVLRIVDETMVGAGFEPETYDVQVLGNEWTISPDEGYAQKLRTTPALRPQYLGATTLSPAALSSVTTALVAGPWRFGPGSVNDAHFDTSEFA